VNDLFEPRYKVTTINGVNVVTDGDKPQVCSPFHSQQAAKIAPNNLNEGEKSRSLWHWCSPDKIGGVR
jgi:hypothetical protein